VYFAERLAAHIRQDFPQVNVRLQHREEGGWPREAPRPAEAPEAKTVEATDSAHIRSQRQAQWTQ
jgi:hypothetical protein